MMRKVQAEAGHAPSTESFNYRVSAPVRSVSRAGASSGVGAQLTATLSVAIGLFAIGCAVVSGNAHTLIVGNPLAEAALEKGGFDAIIIYRALSLGFGLALVCASLRCAGIAARPRLSARRLSPIMQGTLSGLVAVNLFLIAWWTGWIFA